MASQSGESQRNMLNLIVLWDVTGLWNLERLTLVCPKAGSTTRESVEEHWEIQMPHPGLLDVATMAPETVEDLPMSLKQSARAQAKTND